MEKIRLDVDRAGEIAVIHGVDTDQALAHLGHSLTTGSVFTDYRALVVDLGGHVEVSAETAQALQDAAHACQGRHQLLEVAAQTADVGRAVRDARRWFRIVDGRQVTGTAGAVVVTVLSTVAAAAAESLRLVRSTLRR